MQKGQGGRPPKEVKVVQCYHCEYATKIKSNLQKHITNVHILKRGVPRERYFACPMCSFSTTRVKMGDHYAATHSVLIDKSRHTFATLDEFKLWKMNIEREETSRFIVLKGVSNLKSYNVWYYRCHRDGFFNSKGTGKRNLKVQGTNKINGCCPAEMKVTEDKGTGRVQVHFVKTHVGHSRDLNRLPLLKQDKDRIAEKLALKVPLNKVLDELQSTNTGEQMERIHLVTRKDILNIASSYKLKNEAVRRSIDGVSSEMDQWVESVESETSAVRLYKPQGRTSLLFPQLLVSDFVLILFNEAQLEYLKCYGSELICFDRTHQRSQHDLELTTVLIIDNSRQSFPVAFMLSNRSDTEMMTMFVSILYQSVGYPLEVDVFMSDVSNVYYNAWCTTMPLPATRLFSSWHVERAWRRRLIKIKNTDKRAQANKIVRSLVLERSREAFELLLPPALIDLTVDPELLPFGQFFEAEYGRNYMCWAHCFRLDPAASSTVHLESTHKTIRNVFLQGKKLKRLDVSMNDLMRVVRDKLYDQSIVKHEGLLSPEMITFGKRHDLHSTELNVALERSTSGWRVGHTYDVTPNNLTCPCRYRCEHCRICLHSYKCCCPVSAVDWNVCQHIHTLAAHMKGVTTAEPLKVEEVVGGQLVVGGNHQQQQLEPQRQYPRQLQQMCEAATTALDQRRGPVDDEGRSSLEVLHICEANSSSRELEDLIFKEFSPSKDCELLQAKNEVLRHVQDILGTVETRAHLDVLTNALLPVLPTIAAMKYSDCALNAP